jgi:hypothetical protein
VFTLVEGADSQQITESDHSSDNSNSQLQETLSKDTANLNSQETLSKETAKNQINRRVLVDRKTGNLYYFEDLRGPLSNLSPNK